MTHANLTRWVKAANARRVCDAAFKASRQIVQRTGETRRDRLVAGQPIDGQGDASNGVLDSGVARVSLAEPIIAALLVISGVLAFDLAVLWVAAGKVIERLPF